MQQYYKMPVQFANLLRGADRATYCCSLTESIAQHISLIIQTRMQEYRYDPEFGCKVWEVDFVVPSNLNIWKEEIKTALEEAILRNEHRIEALELKVTVIKDPRKTWRNNQVLEFHIKGSIKGTSQEFEYSDILFFSPYSR